MAQKRLNSQEVRDLFENISTSDEEEVANDNFDSDFSDFDIDDQVEQLDLDENNNNYMKKI